MPWIEMTLDVVAADLVAEPGVVADRDLGLGHELPEDQAEAADQEQPEPGGRGRPAGAVGLAPTSAGAGAGSLLRRSILHAISLNSQPIDSLARAQGDTRHGTRHRTTAAKEL